MSYKGYYTRKQLDARGWSIKLFKVYLPKPHKTATNPVNPAFAPMALYDEKIVEQIEADPEFQRYKEWSVGFRARMCEVTGKKSESRSNI